MASVLGQGVIIEVHDACLRRAASLETTQLGFFDVVDVVSIAWVRGHDQATASPNVPAVASRAMRGACCSDAGVSTTRCTLFCTPVPVLSTVLVSERRKMAALGPVSAVEYVVGLPATSAHGSPQTVSAAPPRPSVAPATTSAPQRASRRPPPPHPPPHPKGGRMGTVALQL